MKETGKVIVERFRRLTRYMFPVCWSRIMVPFRGKDADEAVYNAVVMEQVAKMAYIAYQVNPDLTMNRSLIQKHFLRKHGPGPITGSSENVLRDQ